MQTRRGVATDFRLDTNVCVDYLTGRYPAVIRRLQACSPDNLSVSVIAAQALVGDLILVTDSLAELSRIEGLTAESWRHGRRRFGSVSIRPFARSPEDFPFYWNRR